MKNRGVWSRTVFIALALILFAPVVQAATTVVDTELGGNFTGTIDTAGVDFVQGRFLAAGGEEVVLTVQATGGTLMPTVTIRDMGGVPLAGFSRTIGWMGIGNMTHTFTIPAAGTYFAEIGGDTGSGAFQAFLSGTPVVNTQVLVSGVITDSVTTNPVVGATVTADGGAFATTDGAGAYSGFLDPGNYNFAFMAAGYVSQNQAVTVSAGTPINDLDVALVPLSTASISASATGDTTPGGIVMATVDITMPMGTTINSTTWTQTYGPTAMIAGGNTADATVTLAGSANYKDELIHHLEEPPVTQDQLPPNVPLPGHGAFGGLQDRLQVVGINPFSLEEAALTVLEVEVDTDIGVFTDEVEIHTGLPWKVSTGLRNVPQGVAVLVQAKEHTSYDWTLDPPPGSGATLSDAMTRHPHFTPDVPGLYELTLADVPSGSTTLDVYVGTWRGSIVDQDIDGRPVADTACTFCHNDGFAPDMFTDWAQTGHAEIFTDNLNTSPYWGERCFSCHTVGYDPGTDNGGIDEAGDYADFLTLLGSPDPSNWTTALAQDPETARLANIQCENCHGPQDSFAHGFPGAPGEPRVDISSDVCATCHGEPLRHARFQQWQLSPHANYELAIDESTSGSCSRCHTGNGFLEWLPVLLDNDPTTDPLDSIFSCDTTSNTCVGPLAGQACVRSSDCAPWTPDEAHPQTCVTCHDPHDIGTTTGVGTNATVRISGDTPPLSSGFAVADAGRAAICMTCHNSRRGLRNDSTFDALSASEKARAPHGSAQTDLLVGENAFLVSVGTPGGHAAIEDSCVTCHMESTPPPDILAYNGGGTNHTFRADRDICSDCHSPFLTPDDVQGGIEHLMHVVEDLLEDGYFDLIDALIASGNTIDLNGGGMIVDAADIAEIQFGEFRGRQAITVTFVDMSVVGPHRLPDIDVVGPAGGTLPDHADDALLKGGWNWALVHNDGSVGVHNPFFASSVLTAARDALVTLSGGSRSFEEFRPGTVGSEHQKPFENRRGARK